MLGTGTTASRHQEHMRQRLASLNNKWRAPPSTLLAETFPALSNHSTYQNLSSIETVKLSITKKKFCCWERKMGRGKKKPPLPLACFLRACPSSCPGALCQWMKIEQLRWLSPGDQLAEPAACSQAEKGRALFWFCLVFFGLVGSHPYPSSVNVHFRFDNDG